MLLFGIKLHRVLKKAVSVANGYGTRERPWLRSHAERGND